MSEPHFHPISALPMIAAHVKAWLQEALEDEQLFAAVGSSRLDEATVERTLSLYRETMDDVALFDEQLRRWRTRPLSLTDRKKVDELAMKLARVRSAVQSVLAEANRLRGHMTASRS